MDSGSVFTTTADLSHSGFFVMSFSIVPLEELQE